jgi:hypothetical protein
MENKKTGAGGEIYSSEYGYTDGKSYGINVEEQLASMLSNELAKEIDKQIFRSLGIEIDKNERRKKSIEKIFKISV